jgi:putative Holliday junction resolvase
VNLVTESAPEFRDALSDGGVLLALDIGTKTVGTATCDAGWRFATPDRVLQRGKFTVDRAKLTELIVARNVAGIVVGLPLNMDGSAGPRCQASRAYARNLADLDLPILLWDERLSTASADSAMIDQRLSRAKRAQKIDAQAAAVILQSALDRLTGSAF